MKSLFILLILGQMFSLECLSQANSLQMCLIEYGTVKGEEVKNLQENEFVSYLEKKNQMYLNCIKGKLAPKFNAVDIGGNAVNLYEFKKIIVVNFWFYGCVGCQKEFPALLKLYKNYQRDDILFLSITSDSKPQTQWVVSNRGHTADHIIAEDKRIAKLYGIRYPTTFLIDKNHLIKRGWIGIPNDATNGVNIFYDDVSEALNNLLKQNK